MEQFSRKNTLKVTFPGNVAKPSAFEVHKFIENELGFNEDQLDTIQLVARDKAVYIKVISTTLMQRVLNKYNGIINFKYDNGEIVEVKIEEAGGSKTNVRVFDLPPEIPDNVLKRKNGTTWNCADDKQRKMEFTIFSESQ